MRSLLLPGILTLCGLVAQPGRAQTTVSTVAGSGSSGFVDGPGATARFDTPYGVSQDAAGNTYVADPFNHAIRKISPGGVVTTIGGTGSYGYGRYAGRL